METPDNVSVLVAAEPYLLATALADMLAMAGYRVRVARAPGVRPGDLHACVALVDETTAAAPENGATVWLPGAFHNGSVTVSLRGRRFTTTVARPRELAQLIAALATEAACCTPSLAAG